MATDELTNSEKRSLRNLIEDEQLKNGNLSTQFWEKVPKVVAKLTNQKVRDMMTHIRYFHKYRKEIYKEPEVRELSDILATKTPTKLQKNPPHLKQEPKSTGKNRKTKERNTEKTKLVARDSIQKKSSTSKSTTNKSPAGLAHLQDKEFSLENPEQKLFVSANEAKNKDNQKLTSSEQVLSSPLDPGTGYSSNSFKDIASPSFNLNSSNASKPGGIFADMEVVDSDDCSSIDMVFTGSKKAKRKTMKPKETLTTSLKSKDQVGTTSTTQNTNAESLNPMPQNAAVDILVENSTTDTSPPEVTSDNTKALENEEAHIDSDGTMSKKRKLDQIDLDKNERSRRKVDSLPSIIRQLLPFNPPSERRAHELDLIYKRTILETDSTSILSEDIPTSAEAATALKVQAAKPKVPVKVDKATQKTPKKKKTKVANGTVAIDLSVLESYEAAEKLRKETLCDCRFKWCKDTLRKVKFSKHEPVKIAFIRVGFLEIVKSKEVKQKAKNEVASFIGLMTSGEHVQKIVPDKPVYYFAGHHFDLEKLVRHQTRLPKLEVFTTEPCKSKAPAVFGDVLHLEHYIPPLQCVRNNYTRQLLWLERLNDRT